MSFMKMQKTIDSAIFSEFDFCWIVTAEAQLTGALEELKAANLEMTTRCDSLEESLNKEKANRLVRTPTTVLCLM